MYKYSNDLVEVEVVLSYMSAEDLAKIPQKIWDYINKNKNNKYVWEYDETKSLLEQNLSKDAVAILSYINSEYLLNKEQKELMEQIYKQNDKNKIQSKSNNLSKPYNFISNSKSNVTVKNESAEIIKVEQLSFFSKLIKKVKATFDKIKNNIV